MKNKIMNVIVAFAAALVLVGCGAGNDVNSQDDTVEQDIVDTTVEEATEKETEEAEETVDENCKREG